MLHIDKRRNIKPKDLLAEFEITEETADIGDIEIPSRAKGFKIYMRYMSGKTAVYLKDSSVDKPLFIEKVPES